MSLTLRTKPYDHFMPTTRAAFERIHAELELRRATDHKVAIDRFLTRWNEAPCSLDEACEFIDVDAFDAADEIMCGRA